MYRIAFKETYIFIFVAMHMASVCVIRASAYRCRFIIAYYYFPLVLVVIFQVLCEVVVFYLRPF